jgi:hypothetical protein
LSGFAPKRLIFLKLFDRVYAPLTAGLLQPVDADTALLQHKRSSLDRLYQRITNALDRLLQALGLTFSPSVNENKILVDALWLPKIASGLAQMPRWAIIASG